MAKGQHSYVPRGGELAWTSLSEHTGVTMNIFAVRADPKLVREMWTRYIGEPSLDLGLPIDVRATSIEYVLFVFLESNRRQIARLYAKEFRGGHREQTFAVLALGYRCQPTRGWVLFAPYVFASDTPGWRADREIHGSTRQLGDIEIKPGPGEMPRVCGVSATAIERFGPKELAAKQRIFRIEKTSAATEQRLPSGTAVRQIATDLGADNPALLGRSPMRIFREARFGSTAADEEFFKRGPGVSRPQTLDDLTQPLTSLSAALASGSLPMLFLKQFRDVAFADRACYQAILEAPFALDTPGNVSRATGYELTLRDIDSAPIGRELGIPTGRAVPVDVAFRVELQALTVGKASVISNPDWNPADEFPAPRQPSRLPRYVDRGGEAVWRQPSVLIGARIYGFGVTVPLDRQQKLLDRVINEVAQGSPSTYGPQRLSLHPCLGVDMVMLLFVEYDRIRSGNEADEGLGASTYREFLLSQLAISKDPEFPELDWVIPYICLDADAPRLCGREIFGYPKQQATIPEYKKFGTVKDALVPVKEITVDATVFRRPDSEKAERRQIVSVRVDGPGTPAITPYQHAPDMFMDLIRGAFPRPADPSLIGRLFALLDDGPGTGVDVLNALLLNRVGDVFLKEFREADRPDLACYQVVCKTDMIPVRFHGGGRVDASRYRITVADIASEPLHDYLQEPGLPEGRALTPKFAYVLDLDMELTAGRVIANPRAKDTSLNVSLRRTRKTLNKDRLNERPTDRRVPSFFEPYWAR